MSEPIKVGDLVQVVKPKLCCGQMTVGVGTIFKVEGMSCDHSGRCALCRTMWSGSPSGLKAFGGSFPNGFYVERLKRIPPPLSELDDVKQDEEIHA